MRHTLTVRYVAALGLVLLAHPAATGEGPLPDLHSFLPEVRARLQTDAQRQYGYTYVETQRHTTLDRAGRPTGASVTVIESHPGFPGEARWERVVVRDGRPVSEVELRQEDEERQRQTNDFKLKLTRQTAADRAKQEREWDKQRRELADSVDDVFRVYEIVMLGREPVDGHNTIVFSLTPRPGAKAISEDGQWFRHFKGRAWISESEYELVRLDVEAIDDVDIGMGLLARVRKGTDASFERRKVNGEAWLPIRTRYTMSARVLLLKQVRESVTSEFSDYRKAATAGRSTSP
jgi:hypothetical protein